MLRKSCCCFIILIGILADDVVSKTLGNTAIEENDEALKDKLIFNLAQHPEDSDEIVGGDEVDIKQVPYQVAVFIVKLFICGGIIISENYVLTAAHCTQMPNVLYKIQVGSSLRTSGGQLYDVSQVINHPKYDKRTIDFDVSVIKPSTKIILDSVTTKSVTLPDSTSSLKPGDNLIVSGWGTLSEGGNSSEVLRAVTVPVTSRSYCEKVYSRWGAKITPQMICAGTDEGGKDSCQGDSGGPAVSEDRVLFGIVSWGEGCAMPRVPGVYAYIPPLRNWIKEITGV